MRKPKDPIDTSQLAKANFTRFEEWDFKASKGKTYKMYLKRLGNDTVKAYLSENGFTFGLLVEDGKPLCRIHSFADSIDEMNKTISEWRQTK